VGDTVEATKDTVEVTKETAGVDVMTDVVADVETDVDADVEDSETMTGTSETNETELAVVNDTTTAKIETTETAITETDVKIKDKTAKRAMSDPAANNANTITATTAAKSKTPGNSRRLYHRDKHTSQQ